MSKGEEKCTNSRMVYLQSVLPPVGTGLSAVSGSFKIGSMVLSVPKTDTGTNFQQL